MKSYVRKTLGQQGIRTGHHQTFVGYLFLPPDLDRDLYIKDCLKSQTVSMRDEKGGFWKNVFVSKGLLSSLVFPVNTKSKGSVLVCNKVPRNNVPICVAVLDLKDVSGILSEENQFRIQRISNDKNNSIDLDGRAEKGTLDISVSAKETNKGKFNINVTNADKTAELNLYVKGKVNVLTDEEINLDSLKKMTFRIVDNENKLVSKIEQEIGVGLTITDEWGNTVTTRNSEIKIKENSGEREFKMTPNEVFIGKNGSDFKKLILGEVLKNELEKNKVRVDTIIQALSTALTSSSPDGGALFKTNILTVLNTIQNNEDYSSILSDVVKIE